MGLMDALRRAERQGKSAARRGYDWARHEADDAQRALRRKWRVNPPRPRPPRASSVAQDERRTEMLYQEIGRRLIEEIEPDDTNRLDPREREGEEPDRINDDRPDRNAA